MMYYYQPRPRTRTRPRPSATASRDDLRRGGAHAPTTTTEAPEPSESLGRTQAQEPSGPQAHYSVLDMQTRLLLLSLMEYVDQAQEKEERTSSLSSESSGGEDLVVESSPPPAAPEEEADDTQDMADALSPPRPWRAPRLAVVSVLLCVGVALGALTLALAPLVSASATVTIIPVQQAVTATTQLTVVTTGTANPAHQQVAGRRLSALTLSQQETVPTTGIGHQPARAAQGTITFYNAAPTTQTVAAGTLLVGADGVQVVTEQDAILPAAAPPVEGQASVPAHTLITGPGGNITARDINGACCLADVFAINAAFAGGQDARSYPMVTAQDMSEAVSTLKASLAQSVEAAFGAQLHQDETLITPVPCTPSVSADHAIGGEATRLTVTVDATCTGESYRTQAMHDVVKQIVTQQVTAHLETGYALLGDVQVSITHVSRSTQGMVKLAVTGTGTWGYQFSQGELEHIKTVVAGKSEQDARAMMLQVEGVQSVSITLTQTATLPTDTSRIHLVLVEMP